MLESVFIMLMVFGFISFIIGLFDYWDTLLSFVMCFVSMLFFIGAWAGSVYITIANGSNYSETGVGFICMGLIIVNVIGSIISIMNVNTKRRKPQ